MPPVSAGLRIIRSGRLPEFGVQGLATGIAVVLVLLPLIFLVLTSFRTAPLHSAGEWTLANYGRVGEQELAQLVLNSLRMAVTCLVVALLLGVSLAWLITRTNMPGARWLENLVLAPMLLSPLVGAIAWHLLANERVGLLNKWALSLFDASAFDINSLGGMGWVMGLYYAPYIYLFVSGALKSMDPSLEESARVCGASATRMTRTIALPLVLPAILSGGLLVFILAVEQFGIPLVLGMHKGIYVLPTRIWALMSLRPSDYGLAAVLAVLLMVTMAVGVFLQRRMTENQSYATVTGKGFRPRLFDLGRYRHVAIVFCLLYVLLAIVLPYAALLITSLSRYSGAYWPPTLANYAQVFDMPMFWRAVWNSLVLSIVGATLAMLLTSLVAFIIHRTRWRLRGTLDYLTTIPVAVPGVVMGVGVLWSWLWLSQHGGPNLYGSIWLLMVACITRFIPYGVRSASSTLVQIHPELEESSRVCGKSWLTTLVRITLPLLKPGVIAGWLLLFVIFFRELGMVVLLYTGQSVVLPVLLVELWAEGTYPAIAALSLIQALLLYVLVAAFRRVTGAGLQAETPNVRGGVPVHG